MVLTDGAWETGVHMVGLIREGPHRAFLAHRILVVPTGQYQTEAHFADAALFASVALPIPVVAVDAPADGIV